MSTLKSAAKQLYRKLKPAKGSPILVKRKFTGYSGLALVSYIRDAATKDINDRYFDGHSNRWECLEIITILSRLGFDVEVIEWTETLNDVKAYDVIFDIHAGLQRYAPLVPSSCKKLLHITTNYPDYSNDAEIKRVKEMEARRSCLYSPKRIIDTGYFKKSISTADSCSLLGNLHTLSMFPAEYHKKITLIRPSASQLAHGKLSLARWPDRRRSFLWHGGFGAVHKGLDLVLEIFSKRPDLELHVVGNVAAEKDFLLAYGRELLETNNIHYHGYLNACSDTFAEVINRCACFISPSCSESASVAVATCLSAGLYPIISVDTGIDLPSGCGIILNTCSVENVSSAIDAYLSVDDDGALSQAMDCKDFAAREYSRVSFSKSMKKYISSSIGAY